MRAVAGLLQPERAGVPLLQEFQRLREFQPHPGQSTDAMVLHHPEASYFNAGGRQ
ncbi:hypothetical protein [Streptomyces sp. NPDC093544]|jgi:5-methyltetrahydrofolate--homocysteine methyltransferase|uniref:hypothetical protein n=1 Tax=Streptomyces sp. NPDC093544 TaxID=3155200 RepID=UPI00341F5713